MSELDKLLKQYRETFGEDVPDGAIDFDVLIKLIKQALKDGKPMVQTDDFIE
jgi:hypothetical protein